MQMIQDIIVFDIDGTIADLNHRVHHVNGKYKDWNAFNSGLHLDEPIDEMIEINNQLYASRFPIFLCSGRSEDQRKVTEEWLSTNGVSYEKLFMRPSGDYRPDHIIKEEMLKQWQADGYQPFIIFDDRPTVVEMWRKNGLYVLQPDHHFSDTKHDQYLFHDRFEFPLVVMVGPSGAGKTTATKEYEEQGYHVFHSDDVRHVMLNTLEDMSHQARVFEGIHNMTAAHLKAGCPVVIDATHLRRADRVASAKVLPTTHKVLYHVLNRPMAEKIKGGGWRLEKIVRGKPIMEYHEEIFNNNLKYILNGDGLPNVTILDRRT